MPLADHNQAGAPQAAAAPAAAQNNGAEPAAAATLGPAEPDPAQAAVRLVEHRRNANANWLMDQVRRAERAGLLFLASIAPGVAERHIAHLEAQVRAERERRQAAEEAAAAAFAVASTAAAAAAAAHGPLNDAIDDVMARLEDVLASERAVDQARNDNEQDDQGGEANAPVDTGRDRAANEQQQRVAEAPPEERLVYL